MKYLYLLFVVFFISSCSFNNISPSEALEGKWTVTEIYQRVGERSEFGILDSVVFHEEGAGLGQFSFGATSVDYTFKTLDTIYTDNTTYFLKSEKVNSGFTRVNKYTVVTNEGFDFGCHFGDETSNSHEDANDIRLIYKSSSDEKEYLNIQLFLVRQ